MSVFVTLCESEIGGLAKFDEKTSLKNKLIYKNLLIHIKDK